MRALSIVLLIIATSAAFAEPGWYIAQEAVRAAAIGTYSARHSTGWSAARTTSTSWSANNGERNHDGNSTKYHGLG